jgi:hypothetical protein
VMTDKLETPSDDNPDGGHHLVIELGDCEFYGRCMCGVNFGSLRPNQSLNEFGYPWERHVMGLGAVQ